MKCFNISIIFANYFIEIVLLIRNNQNIICDIMFLKHKVNPFLLNHYTIHLDKTISFSIEEL